MRSALLGLCLVAGSVALAQSSPAKPADSFKLELNRPALTQPAMDSVNSAIKPHGTNAELWKSFTMADPRVLRRDDTAQIDPGMVVRPPRSSVGDQPRGTPIEQKLYPGLQLLPIDQSKASSQSATK